MSRYMKSVSLFPPLSPLYLSLFLTPNIADNASQFDRQSPMCSIYLKFCMRGDSLCAVGILLKRFSTSVWITSCIVVSFREGMAGKRLELKKEIYDENWPKNCILLNLDWNLAKKKKCYFFQWSHRRRKTEAEPRILWWKMVQKPPHMILDLDWNSAKIIVLFLLVKLWQAKDWS